MSLLSSVSQALEKEAGKAMPIFSLSSVAVPGVLGGLS